jgi:DNA-binding transcriptional LysR family regulator
MTRATKNMTTTSQTLANESLTIRQLEVFAMASRSTTFSDAARKLGISQPSLSNTIAKIEGMLGVSLFDRTTRSLVLTREGERLAAMADNLVRDFRAALVSIHDTAQDRRGRLSLAVLPSVASSIAPDALCLFYESYPEFDVALHDTGQEKGLGWVSDRAVDFGVFATAAVPDLYFESVYQDEFQIICRNDSPLAAKAAISWKDLSYFPIILTGSGPIRRDVEAAWSRANVSIAPRYEIEQILTGLALVSAGLGVTILPSLYLPKVINENLVPLRFDNAHLSRSIGFVRRTDRTLSTPARDLIDCFRRVFAKFESEHGPSPKGKAARRTSKR